MAELAYNCEIVSKGMLLNSEMAIQRSIIKTGDKALIKQWNAARELQGVFQHAQAGIQYIETDSIYTLARNIADTVRIPELDAKLKTYDVEKLKIDSLHRYVMSHKKNIIRELISEYDYSFSANFTSE